jgi:predicted RNA-binding Zn ribbon-like protein
MARHAREPQTHSPALAPRHDLCLDFANTLAWRGSTPTESLHGLADVVEWCSSSGGAIATIDGIESWARAHPVAAMSIFRDAIAIRETLYRIFHALASGAVPSDGNLDALNRALRAAPARISVRRTRHGFGWEIPGTKPTAPGLLAAVLWSAGDLLVGPQRGRVSECANGQCLWLFLDDSKNRTRRWCSMKACGNRAKARRHYLRHADR